MNSFNEFIETYKIGLWLWLICIVGFIVYTLKLIDAEESQNKPKGYLIRKAVLGGIGNAVLIFGLYHILCYITNLDDMLILVFCAFVSYIGADTIFKILEKALERYILNKADLLSKK